MIEYTNTIKSLTLFIPAQCDYHAVVTFDSAKENDLLI